MTHYYEIRDIHEWIIECDNRIKASKLSRIIYRMQQRKKNRKWWQK